MGSYKWVISHLIWGYNYSYPTYNATYNYPEPPSVALNRCHLHGVMSPLFGFRRSLTGASGFFLWTSSLDGIARLELDGPHSVQCA